MSRKMTRAERLIEMERLYQQADLSDQEIAQRLGVNRTTVFRDRVSLETRLPFVQTRPGHYRIDRLAYLASLQLTLYEAVMLYLAARRSAHDLGTLNSHAVTALQKLTGLLRKPLTEQLVQAATQALSASTGDGQSGNHQYKILEVLSLGWVNQQKVSLTYRNPSLKHRFVETISPLLIEPSPWEPAVYIIGYRDSSNPLQPIKLEWIEHADILTEHFDYPAEVSAEELLRKAWDLSPITSMDEKVILRFSAAVATRRVKTNKVHPLQETEDLPDGGFLWRAPISAWQEMLPWIRGWGAEVEVLKPDSLRESLKAEAARLASLYP